MTFLIWFIEFGAPMCLFIGALVLYVTYEEFDNERYDDDRKEW